MSKHLANIALILLVGSLAFGYGMNKRDMWAPDEPRFAEAAKEMIQRGDLFVLHVNNQPYSDKPPLVVWIAAGLELARGGDGSNIASWTVRFPSVFGGLLGLLATYVIGLALFDSRRAALLSAVALATTLMYAYQAARAQLDMLMAGLGVVAVMAFVLADRAPRLKPRLAWWGLFWIAGGLATLSKGPPALIVALGTAAFFLMWRRDGRKTLRTAIVWTATLGLVSGLAQIPAFQSRPLFVVVLVALGGLIAFSAHQWFLPLRKESPGRFAAATARLLLGAALAAAVVCIWFIPYSMNAPSASEDTLLTQTVTRYFAGISHVEAPWFYVENLPHNLLPWTIFFGFAVWLAFRRETAMGLDARRFLVSWALFTFVFFTLSPGKRDQYLLPGIPACALWVGWFFDRAARRLEDGVPLHAVRLPAWINAVVAGIAGFALLAAQFLVGSQGFRQWLASKNDDAALLFERVDVAAMNFWLGAVILLTAAAVLVYAARRARPLAAFIGSALLMGGFGFYVNGFVLPPVDAVKSGRELTDAVMAARPAPDTRIATFNGVFRAQHILYADYFVAEIPEDEERNDPELTAFLDAPGPAFVIMRDKDWREIQGRHPDRSFPAVFEMQVGGKELVVIHNDAEASPAGGS